MRADECRWLDARLATLRARRPRVLDVGCGNGALLGRWAGRIGLGIGVDVSPAMIARARARARARVQDAGGPARRDGAGNLAFLTIAGGGSRSAAVTEPRLPFPRASFDAVVSLLSFRYLDWEPMTREVQRVLAPGGRLLVVDMVRAPLAFAELPRLCGTSCGAPGPARATNASARRCGGWWSRPRGSPWCAPTRYVRRTRCRPCSASASRAGASRP